MKEKRFPIFQSMDLKRIKTPSEKITGRNPMITMYNAERFVAAGKFVVDLECGHKVYTRNQNRSVCPRCTEMLRRSIKDGSEDYESFRKGLVRDMMEWPGDPCRVFNESHLR
jgi:hypothetical protein